MDVLFIFTSTAFFIWTIRNIVAWTLLWEEKDYNWRRLFLHLKETAKGRNILFSPLSLIKWIAVFFYFYVIFQEHNTVFFHFTVIGIYIAQAFFVMKDLLLSRNKRPEFSRLSLIVILLSLVTVAIIFSIPLLDKYFWILFIDRLTVILVSFFVFVASFPTELVWDKEIENALKKMKSHKDLMTIGIVGSYGKSSTKEFLYQLLSNNYKVVKTRGHQNTLAEIAHTILKYLKKSTQIFIVEMNDFAKGDIQKIADMVKPNIGIITGVNPQHLSLFKTLSDSIASKSELVQSLPRKSLILFNGNDAEIRGLYEKDKKTKRLYILGKKNPTEDLDKKTICAENKKVLKDNISFDVVFGSKKIHINSPLIGGQNIENLLPAIYLADYLGMKDSEIKKAALTLHPPENTMVKKVNEAGVFLIDDTSNTNPESIFAALNYMKLYKKKKIVVMQTMIELGKEAKSMHKKIAQRIAEQCDVLFVTNTDYLKLMEKSIGESGKKCRILHIPTKKIVDYINENTEKGDIILFEGSDARNVLDQLI